MTEDEPEADKLVVVGQGYVGLPLAMRAVEAGFTSSGFDTDAERIKRLAADDSYVEDVPFRGARRRERIRALRADDRAQALRRIRLRSHRRPDPARRRRPEPLLRDRRR